MPSELPKPHPYADLFPMMTAGELDALAADIASVGLMHPVVLYQGQVLDGRNRLLACQKAGVEPTFIEHEGDDASALALVISLNVQRRDLTSAQRAIVAARAMPLFEEAGLARMKTGKSADGESGGRGKRKDEKPSGGSHQRVSSREAASQVFKVGAQSVQQAKALLSEAPDLATQVESCTTNLASAYEQLQARRKEAERKQRDLDRVAEYRDAISSGEITIEAAIQKAVEDDRQEREKKRQDAESRQIWFEDLERVVRWAEDRQGASDACLAWYTQQGEPGTQSNITTDRITVAIRFLERIKTITFGG